MLLSGRVRSSDAPSDLRDVIPNLASIASAWCLLCIELSRSKFEEIIAYEVPTGVNSKPSYRASFDPRTLLKPVMCSSARSRAHRCISRFIAATALFMPMRDCGGSSKLLGGRAGRLKQYSVIRR